MSTELNEKLHKMLPSLRNAITVVIGMHPETMSIFEMVDEIWQLQAGIGLLSKDDDSSKYSEVSPKVGTIPDEDVRIFEDITEIYNTYPVICIEGLKNNNADDGKTWRDGRTWAIAVPSIDYTWGIADSPSQFLEAVKQCAEVYVNHKKQELLQDPMVHEAYVLQAQHNEAVDEHNKDVLERNGMPYELHFKVDIEFHDDLRWLIGTSVTDGGRWASTPDELLKAVKDNIEYLETHADEIKQLLGG